MSINTKAQFNYPKWRELTSLKTPEDRELDNIKYHLDLVLLALEAIANIRSEAMIKAAQDLYLESVMVDRLNLWQLKSSDPKRETDGKRKKLDVEEARSLVLIICYLANQHQELLRRGVSLLEQVTEQNQPPHQTALLGNYLDRFINSYQERIANPQYISSESLAYLPWKLLSDLLFYSGHNGHRLLWGTIFDTAQINAD
ncbi:MAG: DUF3038 domain-containing protein [Waterburya sp.]